MDARTLLLGAGVAVTTFLVAGAATIQLLGAGDAPGVGIVGVFVGSVAALAAGGAVSVLGGRVPFLARLGLVAYGTFGVAFATIAAMSYVNVPGVDDVFTFTVRIAVSLLVAVVATVVAFRRRVVHDRSRA